MMPWRWVGNRYDRPTVVKPVLDSVKVVVSTLGLAGGLMSVMTVELASLHMADREVMKRASEPAATGTPVPETCGQRQGVPAGSRSVLRGCSGTLKLAAVAVEVAAAVPDR